MSKKTKGTKPDLAIAKFERYLSFKIRFIEALQFAKLRNDTIATCKPGEGGHDCAEHLVHTFQAALYTWVAGLNDEDSRSVNVFRLWKEFFESNILIMKKLDEAKAEIGPGLDLIRIFRNRHGAHADRFDILLATHRALQEKQPLIEKSVGYFLEICEALVLQENSIFPDFGVRLDAFMKAHNLNDTFRCIAISTPTLREIKRGVQQETPAAYQPHPAFDITPINVMGKKMAVRRLRNKERS
ncbi:MAG TPA: hypothetical protein VI386_02565 [Candidatus Sulfotelmatobacter sp.]